LEWDVVYLIHATDDCLPSDITTGSDKEIEEELRLAYVAMTRARDSLYVLWPQRYYLRPFGFSDRHSYAQCSRFFTDDVLGTMEERMPGRVDKAEDSIGSPSVRGDIAHQIRYMWE